VTLPGSKSYTNRALPIAALAKGQSLLVGALESDDTRYMVAALRELGIQIETDWPSGRITVAGCDGRLPAEAASLFLGNSGTSMRFLTALVSLGHGRYVLDGDEHMRRRPLGPLVDGLASLGLSIRSVELNGYPPVVVEAAGLPGGVLTMPGDLSSQYFSAVAMVAPYAQTPLEIQVSGELVSKPYLDLTAASMAAFGVNLHHENYQRIWVEPGQRYRGTTYQIEPDASAASYFFALAAVTGGTITVEHLPWSSAQGDLRFVDILEAMGCRVDRSGEAVTVTGPAQLDGVEVDMNAISDTVMTLAAIAPFASGPVRIHNVGHIRLKETDRLSALATELDRLGIKVEETADSLTVYPGVPKPETVQTYDDHRMAMSFAVTAAVSGGIAIANPGCVAKTVPRFWEIFLPLIEG
jgi:3-phosphoshikimate 1-carboxyvinyltransferase